MTLNGVMTLILRYFTEFGSFRGAPRKVVEDVIVKKFTFAISSPDKFLVCLSSAFYDGTRWHCIGTFITLLRRLNQDATWKFDTERKTYTFRD